MVRFWLLCLLATACNRVRSLPEPVSTAKSVDDAFSRNDFTCPTGSEPAKFQLHGTELAIENPAAIFGIDDKPHAPTANANIRIDTCLGSDDSVTLQRIYFRPALAIKLPFDMLSPQIGNRRFAYNLELMFIPREGVTTSTIIRDRTDFDDLVVYEVPPIAMTGLNAAAFGDASSLALKVNYEADRSFELKAVGNGLVGAWVEGTPYNALNFGTASDSASRILFGTFGSGDPFGLCPEGYRVEDKVHRVLGVTIALQTCNLSQGAGNGAAWDEIVRSAKVSAPNLGGTSCGLDVQVDGIDATAEVVTFFSDQHHHFCDAWRIKSGSGVLYWGCLNDSYLAGADIPLDVFDGESPGYAWSCNGAWKYGSIEGQP